MNRPELSQFFPENTTPDDINRVFLRHPNLYKYITALDAYVDWLEGEKTKDAIVIPNMPVGFRIDILPVPFMKKGVANLLVHPDNYPDKIELKTDHGDLNVFRSKFLKHGEIGIMDLSFDPPKLEGVHFPEPSGERYTLRGLTKKPDQE